MQADVRPEWTVLRTADPITAEVQALFDRGAEFMLNERAKPAPRVPSLATPHGRNPVSAQAAQVAARHGDVVRLASAWSGRWATFLGDQVVIRVIHDSSNDDVIAQTEALAGLPRAPQLIEVDRSAGVIVERRFPGRTLDSAWEGLSTSARRRSAREILDFRDELSSVPLSASAIEAAKGRLERDVNQLFGPELSGWALQQLGNDVRWRHCDLHAENILVDDRSGEVTAVVDWEWADVTVAALDQSRILAVGAYQVGREWGLEAAGAIDPDTLLVAFALHTVPHAHQPGQSAFYDAILSSVRARAGAA